MEKPIILTYPHIDRAPPGMSYRIRENASAEPYYLGEHYDIARLIWNTMSIKLVSQDEEI